MGKVRIAQKVFPTMMMENDPTEISNDVIKFPDLSIQEGCTKPFVEIYQELPLTSTQVNKETQNKTCKTLARMAAKAIALAEDSIFFQGKSADATLKANRIRVELLDSTDDSLLGEAKVTKALNVAQRKPEKPGLIWGENIFSVVAEGIANLTSNAQAPQFALFLPTKAYADTFVSPSDGSLVTTAERIRSLVERGFYGTGTLPADRGLLVALGGDPTTLYVGREATTEFVRKDGGTYVFRVVERIQFVARDARALVLLKFGLPAP